MLITSGTDLLVGNHAHDNAVVTVSGELDATTARDLEDRLNHVDEGVVVLDLADVTFFDSVGLASVLNTICRGIDVRVVGSRQVTRTIALTGTASEVPLFGSVSDAIRGHNG